MLVDTVGWRGVFFVNVPVCFAIGAVGRRLLPAMRPTGVRHDLDLVGALLVTAAAALLVLAPSIGASDGWTSAPFAAAIAAAAPTPGGLGAMETALVAGLTAVGAPSGPAIAGVLAFRLVTFWLPILPGWLVFRRLLRERVL